MLCNLTLDSELDNILDIQDLKKKNLPGLERNSSSVKSDYYYSTCLYFYFVFNEEGIGKGKEGWHMRELADCLSTFKLLYACREKKK